MMISDETKNEIQETKIIENENQKTKNSKILVTAFSVAGSLLLGIGITILLVGLWERFPVTGRVIISFIPMLLGQGGAIFTFLKKKDNVLWREGASVLWSVGVSATVGMFSALFGIHLGVLNCLLIDALLVLPVIFFFKATVPLAFYYCAAFAGAVGVWDSLNTPVWTALIVAATLIPGIIFTLKSISEKDNRYGYCKWITAIASGVGAIITGISMNSEPLMFMIFGAAAICMYALSEKDSWSSPCYLFGVAGAMAVNGFATYFTLIDNIWSEFDGILTAENIATAVICLALFAVAFLKGEKNFEKDGKKLVFCGAGAVNVILFAISSVFCKDYKVPLFISILIFASMVVMAVTLIVKGAQDRTYYSMNIGLITLFSVMFSTLFVYDVDMLIVGLMFIISGLILFGANYRITKSIKKDGELLSEKAVENNE